LRRDERNDRASFYEIGCHELLMTVSFAPVALFAFTRLSHLRRTVEALVKNDGAANS